jgi:predicted GNAT family acetyltransferase
MRHFVFEIETEIVACAGGFIKDDIPHCFFKPSFYGFIGDVYTFPEYRKNGYATKLTKGVVKWLKEKEVRSIRLFASKEGKDIYEKIGFEESDEMVLELD